MQENISGFKRPSLLRLMPIVLLAFLFVNENLYAAKTVQKPKPATKSSSKAPIKKAPKIPAKSNTPALKKVTSISNFIPFPKEVRGVWISFLDWEKMPFQKNAFEKEVAAMLDRCVSLHLNTVFVHVRSHADAMYNSSYFPWSRFITGTQGINPGYDPLKIFIEQAHKRGLGFHAWINPYRVTGYLNEWDKVSSKHPAKLWLNDAQKYNDRWILQYKKDYYLNPSIPLVRSLIVSGIKEIIENYNVDGIHFDDYFYPELDDPDNSFDNIEYSLSGSKMSLENWRRNNINLLMQEVYYTVKKAKPNAYFGVSPLGYMTKLKSNNFYLVDIDTWFAKPGYVDYIIPQIYWGFEAKTSAGTPAPFAFTTALKDWIELKKKSNVKLFIGLALYKTGRKTPDNNKKSEWIRYNNIMKRQIEASRATGLVTGFVFYNYKSFQYPCCQQEVKNIISVFK